MTSRRISIFFRSLLALLFTTILLSTMYYFVFVKTEKLDEIKKGLAFVECSGTYVVSEDGAPKFYFSDVDTIKGMSNVSLTPSYSKKYSTAVFVLDSVAVGAISQLQPSYSIQNIENNISLIISKTLKFARNLYKVRKHQYEELKYYVETHDSLDEGFTDAVEYEHIIKSQIDSLQSVIGYVSNFKSKHSKIGYDYKVRICAYNSLSDNTIYDCMVSIPKQGNIFFLKPLSYFKSNYVFSKSVFLIRRIISSRRFSLTAVSKSLPETLSDFTVLGASANVADRKVNMIHYSSSDGSAILDDKLRFLGINSNDEFVTSNRINNSLRKIRW